MTKLDIQTYIEKRTSKVIAKQEEKTIATQEDALKALSEMITAGFTTQATSKKIKRVDEDDNGNPIIVEETTASIRPSDMTKAIELMAKLQGWGNQTLENELSAVDKHLAALESQTHEPNE